jgi:hypothetical protein
MGKAEIFFFALIWKFFCADPASPQVQHAPARAMLRLLQCIE